MLLTYKNIQRIWKWVLVSLLSYFSREILLLWAETAVTNRLVTLLFSVWWSCALPRFLLISPCICISHMDYSVIWLAWWSWHPEELAFSLLCSISYLGDAPLIRVALVHFQCNLMFHSMNMPIFWGHFLWMVIYLYIFKLILLL